MTDSYKIGIAGLGTVGAGVAKILQKNAELITARSGKKIEIVYVGARDKTKDRGVDLTSYEWVDNPLEMLDKGGIDCVVELMGGSEGIAYDLVKGALEKGISVVTANKALLAHHGYGLAQIAESNGAQLYYEAAVAGGIPIIKALREGFAANEVKALYGILNGTCNYILSVMRETGRSFDDVLKEAQDKGYAEADPAFDIEGTDASHKLALLAAIAYGVKPDLDNLPTSGVSRITATDIAYAEELGYRIKLLGIASRRGDKVMQIVEPCFVDKNAPIAAVENVFNAVFIDGDFVDTGMAIGHGAGEGPTASAVVADLIDLARGMSVPVFGIPVADVKDADWADVSSLKSGFYVRLEVLDKPGVLADISTIMRDHEISMEVVLQRGRNPDKPVTVVVKTHEATRAAIEKAGDALEAHEAIVETPSFIRISSL